MSTSWSESYSGQLRKLVGHQKLIIPSIRGIIQDEHGRILLPAGGIELNESIFECLQREVKEEAGFEFS